MNDYTVPDHPVDRAIADAAQATPLSRAVAAKRVLPVLIAGGAGGPEHYRQLRELPEQRAALVRLWDHDAPSWPMLARAVLGDPELVALIQEVYVPTASAHARQTEEILASLCAARPERLVLIGGARATFTLTIPAGALAADSGSVVTDSRNGLGPASEPGSPDAVADALNVTMAADQSSVRVTGPGGLTGERVALLVRNRMDDADEVSGPLVLNPTDDGRAQAVFPLTVTDVGEVVVLVLAR